MAKKMCSTTTSCHFGITRSFKLEKALDLGVDLIKGGMPFSNRLMQKLHKVLMTNARETNSAGGEYRIIQNFIGPNSNIEHAVYIPVSVAEIPQYMENLEYFMNGEVHSSFKKNTMVLKV